MVIVSAAHCFGQTGAYCGKKGKLPISEIQKQFRYNRTKSIKLVSFKYEDPELQSDTADIEVPAYHPEIPKTNGAIDLTKMSEVKTLDDKTADELLDILVNYDNEDRPSEVAFCYEPRNGILFLDSGSSVVAYIEICFECLRYKVEPSTATVSHFCTEKFDALKTLFRKAGVNYGVTPNRRR